MTKRNKFLRIPKVIKPREGQPCERCKYKVRRRLRCDICRRLLCARCLDWSDRKDFGRGAMLTCVYDPVLMQRPEDVGCVEPAI
jgi:hypothetical protein